MSDIQFHPIANVFPLIEGAEFRELVEDVREHGLREPVILHEGMILDGRNRYRACQAAQADCHFEVFSGGDPVAYVVSLNLRRRHLSESQRAFAAGKIANLKAGDNQHSGSGGANLPDLPIAPAPISVAKAADMLNVSERSVKAARAVLDHGAPELAAKVAAGTVSVSAAADVARLPEPQQREIVAKGEREILEAAKQIRAERAETRRTERIERIAEISKGNAPLVAERRYPIILADPPWRYENPPMGGTNRSIENHYPTLDLNGICALPVASIAADDALLYLWATAPKLAECFSVIEAWGFEYRTCFVWVKDKIGMGYHARNQHEILLVAKRGAIPPPPVEARASSVITAARGEHSEKPIEFYELIERMYPTLPRIELFARAARDGWASWGNQAPGAAA